MLTHLKTRLNDKYIELISPGCKTQFLKEKVLKGFSKWMETASSKPLQAVLLLRPVKSVAPPCERIHPELIPLLLPLLLLLLPNLPTLQLVLLLSHPTQPCKLDPTLQRPLIGNTTGSATDPHLFNSLLGSIMLHTRSPNWEALYFTLVRAQAGGHLGLLTLSFARSPRVTPASNVHAHHTLDEVNAHKGNKCYGRTDKQTRQNF